uniref:Uncharacterized protein n=1 Tax=Ciona savignyi TaxID=51511 RepID=H2ZNC5_CIOSA
VVVLGFSQKIISCIVIAVCLATVIVCLIILFRVPDLFEPPGRKLSTSSKSGSFTSDSETNGLLPRRSCDSESLSNELSPSIPLKWWEFRSGKNQLTRHIVLLSLLAISLFVGLTITAWRLSDHNMLSGIYFEVSFLDSVFNFGQSFFVFLIFGIDTELIIEPFMKAGAASSCGTTL